MFCFDKQGRKEVFEWIKSGNKNIELRRGKAKKGDDAVFQCGRRIVRGKIIKKEEGSFTDVLRKDNYKAVIPSAKSLEDAIGYLKRLYSDTNGTFTAYYFEGARALFYPFDYTNDPIFVNMLNFCFVI